MRVAAHSLNLVADPGGASMMRRCLAVVVLALASLTLGPTSSSGQESGDLGDRETRETASMREAIYKELARAQEKADENEYAEALRLLDKLSSKDLHTYERSQLWNLYGYVYYSQERYTDAIGAFEKLLAEEGLPKAIEATTVFSLAQLYFTVENWQRAKEMLNRWFASATDPRPQHYKLLAQTHYELEEYREAIAPMRKAIALKKAGGGQISESSYLFLRVVYYELGDYAQVAAILEELIRRFPGDKYWMQLAGVYSERGEERKRLNTLELAYLQGYLDTEPELLTLAGLHLNNDLPYRAGKILEAGLGQGIVESKAEHWRLLAQAWTLAKEDERAIPALTRAADMAEDGELDIMLAQSYMNLDQFDEAARAARAGIRKGKLRREDQAYVMLGQILFNMDAFEESRQAFQQAQTDARSRKLAAQWLRYITSELERQAQLEAALEG